MSKTVAIMQPYLFPYLGYVQLMMAVDHFILFDTAQYIRRGWINKNRIKVQGKAHSFTLPTQKAPQKTLIQDILLSSDQTAPKKTLQTLRMSYQKSPYFQVIYPLLEEILLSKETHLSVLLHKQFVSLYRYLDLKINFSLASEHHWRPATGSMQRIISMCQDLKATNYINPWNGQTLYSFQDFQKHQLNLSFIRMKEHPYPQGNGDFIPSLSIIDILMWNSIEQIKESLGKYELFSSQEELRKENQPS